MGKHIAKSSSLTTTTTLDANVVHCLATGASLTPCLHFCNQTPTDWYSKKRATVEMATFLNGDLDHKIFMKMPEGYKECVQDYEDGKALKLDKAIYGLVQAARQFWKKLTSKLKEAGLEQSIVDPCLFQHNNDRGLSILIMYIDDLLIIGKPETNESTINDLKQYFDIKKPTKYCMIISVFK